MAESAKDAASSNGDITAGALASIGFSLLRESVSVASLRKQREHLYTTLEDFGRTDPDLKRMVVIGCTGAGKSTLLNIMGGWTFVQRPPDYEFAWERELPAKAAEAATSAATAETATEQSPSAPREPSEPLFESGAGGDSVTKRTSFANLSWFGDEAMPFIAVDTPGHDDPAGADIDSPEAREALGEIAADLHNKLKALGTIHAILVLHNDVLSNRLNPATYTILKMIGEKFAKVESGSKVWEHVIIGYSKCNEHDVSWRSGLASKRTAMQAAIRQRVAGCEIDLPVVNLGGATLHPKPPAQINEASGFDQLWQFLQSRPPLDCSELQPFEGPDVKWEKMVNEKDLAEAKAKAALVYTAVLLKVATLLGFLFWRAFLLPRFFAFLLACVMGGFAVYSLASNFGADLSSMPRTPVFIAALAAMMVNMHTVMDEVAILALFVWAMGPMNIRYSMEHCYSVWLAPSMQPTVDKVWTAVEPQVRMVSTMIKQQMSRQHVAKPLDKAKEE